VGAPSGGGGGSSGGVALFVFALGVWYIWGDHEVREQRIAGFASTAPAQQVQVTRGRTTTSRTAPTRTERSYRKERASNPVADAFARCPDAAVAIDRLKHAQGIPPGLLYGVWSVEAKRQCGGMPGRHRAADLRHKGAFYAREWGALVAVCAQTRRDGSKVCDPYQVYGSRKMAIGMMQTLPSNILRRQADGRYAYTRTATDLDGDGVVDPFTVGDALGSATRHLLRDVAQVRGERDRWRRAAIAYNAGMAGNNPPYYDGWSERAPGVKKHWLDWCREMPCIAQATR
jgi:membrane-bound lytic murein transglycosylase B